MKTLSTICVATAAIFIGSTAALAVPVVGNPLVGGGPTLNSTPGPGGFDVDIGSHAGSFGAQIGNGTWSGTASACAAIGNPAGCGTNQEIAELNTNWVVNNTGVAQNGNWISFADTGVVGDDGDPGTIFNDPVNEIENGTYTYTFSFTTGDTMAHMGLWVYADDTAEVYISGGDIADGAAHGFDDGVPDGRQQISLDAAIVTDAHCGPGALAGIGCQNNEQAFIEMFFLTSDTTYTIEIETIQVSDRAFGLLFAGGLQNVPEPATLALLGLGLVGVGAARRRRQKVA